MRSRTEERKRNPGHGSGTKILKGPDHAAVPDMGVTMMRGVLLAIEERRKKDGTKKHGGLLGNSAAVVVGIEALGETDGTVDSLGRVDGRFTPLSVQSTTLSAVGSGWLKMLTGTGFVNREMNVSSFWAVYAVKVAQLVP